MKRCLDEAQKSLGYIGVPNSQISRLSDDEISVQRSLPDGSTYEIYIWVDQSDIIMFQSIAFKSAHGSLDKELGFYQVILYFNSYLNFVNFGLATTGEDNEWDIVLSSNQLCSQINPKVIAQIIRSFDHAFVEFVPQLKQQAIKWQLDFNGHVRGELGGFYKGNLED